MARFSLLVDREEAEVIAAALSRYLIYIQNAETGAAHHIHWRRRRRIVKRLLDRLGVS